MRVVCVYSRCRVSSPVCTLHAAIPHVMYSTGTVESHVLIAK